MVAPVATAGATVAAKKAADDPWPLIIGAGALILLSKWGFDAVKDKANIVPETGEFVRAVLGGTRKGTYIEDQTGLSPNPPTEEWWDAYYGDFDQGWSREKRDIPPIPVEHGAAVPTPPVVLEPVYSPAEVAGQQTHKWFTQPKLYPWFWLADKL
jgi:hypothetical protein